MKLHLYGSLQVRMQAEFINFRCEAFFFFFFFKQGENPQFEQTVFVKFWKDIATGNGEKKCFRANPTVFKMKKQW